METITIKDKRTELQYDMNLYWKYRIEEYIRYKEQEWMYELEFRNIELERENEIKNY